MLTLIEIENFKKALDHRHLSPSLQVKESFTIKAKSNATDKNRKAAKKEQDNDDNITLIQLHTRTKISTKKVARQKAEKKRSSHKISSDQRNDLNSDPQTSSCQEKFSRGTSLSTSSKPMKKRMINELDNSLHKENEPRSKGPHGDLLGMLFSSALNPTETAIAKAARGKKSSAKDDACCEASKISGHVNSADKLSAASLLLGLGK